MNIKSLATRSCLVPRVNTYNLLARIFFQILQTLRPTTCGQYPENGQLRLPIVRYGSMDGVSVLDGTALSGVAVPYLAPVKGSQAIGRHSLKIT